jgi:hypothetical protein
MQLDSMPCVAGMLACMIGGSLEAQTCRVTDDSSAYLVAMVQKIATASTPYEMAARDSLRIPAADSAGVQLVKKETVCKNADTAYRKVATGYRASLTGRVYVVQVRTTYVVWDPGYHFRADDPMSEVRMVFDARWELQSLFD